jgi:hypothetical protein
MPTRVLDMGVYRNVGTRTYVIDDRTCCKEYKTTENIPTIVNRPSTPEYTLLFSWRVQLRFLRALERLSELRDVADRAVYAELRRRVGVGPDELERRSWLRLPRPDTRKRDEEQLFPGIVQTGQEVLISSLIRGIVLLLPCAVCLDEAGVADVLSGRPK